MHLEIIGTYRSKHWRGNIIATSGQRYGLAAYDEATDTLTVSTSSDTLAFGGIGATEHQGEVLFNQQVLGTYKAQESGELEVLDASGHPMLLLLRDSSRRRTTWAYRQGLSASQSHAYALWGDLLITRGSIYSSIMRRHHWLIPPTDGLYPLLSGVDEKLLLARPTEEQLMVIALAARYLCFIPGFNAANLDDSDLQDIQSYVVDEQTGLPCVDPDIFPPRPHEKFFLEAPVAKCAFVFMTIIYFIALLLWDFPEGYPLSRKIPGAAIMFFLVNGIPLGWIVLMKTGNSLVNSESARNEKRIHQAICRMMLQRHEC